MVLAMSPWFSTAAVLPQLREAWGLDRVAGSWLTIAVQIGFVVGAVGSSLVNLADRIPPRRLMLYGTVLAAAANAAPAWFDSYGPTLLARLVTGAALAAVYPPALKAMSTWFVRGRGLALGVMVGALTVGSGLPHVVNGVGGAGWRPVLLVTSAATIGGGLVAEFAGSDGPHRFPSAPFEPAAVGRALADPKVLLASAGYFGHMWELYAMWAWFGAFYADVLGEHGWADTTRPAAFAAAAVIGIGALGAAWAGWVSDRYSRELSAAVPMLVSGTVAAVIGYLTALPPLLVLLLGLVWGAAVVADSAQFSTVVTEVADQRYVGTSLTVQLASGFVLTVATIFLVPVVRDAWGWGPAFTLLAPGPLLGALAMRALARRRAAEAPPVAPPAFVSPFF
ncbi:MAG: MFS transporter [Actinomyces sp.]|nr:MAG: MFS transporter [Actinomyces sp.]